MWFLRFKEGRHITRLYIFVFHSSCKCFKREVLCKSMELLRRFPPNLKLSISFAEAIMADADVELKKRRTFRKFTYRGVDLDQLLDMNNEQLMELFVCRIRRKFSRGLKR